MPSDDYNPSTTADLLLDAWRHGSFLRELSSEAKPANLLQGYDAQDKFFEATGGTRAGWKLGVGSPALMRAGGLSRPLIGQLDKGRLHASGAHVQRRSDGAVTVECEIGFVLARDLVPMAGREVQPEDIRHACVTFELVRSRFIDRRSVGWPSFAADNVGFEALVIGEPFCDGLDIDSLRRVNDSAVVFVDGEAKAKALVGDDATDPLLSLAALYAHAAERGVVLRAGEIVSTGAMCKPFDLASSGHTLTATYLGQVLTVQV